MQSDQLHYRRGFTLIEVLLAVAIIGILLTIGIPNFLKARTSSHTKTCLTNLWHISHAKEEYAAEEKLSNGQSVEWNDLVPALLKSKPSCPASGEYTIGKVGETPQCNIDEHVLP
ncbi:prepilin-type N-terminal cleavage/methylation domain-containing protein [bacterium]|nr:prepilin-type N-terminal cleavage/methylation domain-containing protein [bacterium]